MSVKFSLTFARRVWSDSENRVLSAFCSARRLPSRFSARHIERIMTKWCRYSDRFVRILYGLWRNDNVVFTLWRACDDIVTHHVLIVIVCSFATKSACNVSLVVVKELARHSATVVVFAARSKEYVLLFAFYCAVLALPRVLFSPTPILYHRKPSVTTIFHLIAWISPVGYFHARAVDRRSNDPLD